MLLTIASGVFLLVREPTNSIWIFILMSFANLSDVFDKLLAERKLAISREDRKSAETLRVSLTRKLVQYKSQME